MTSNTMKVFILLTLISAVRGQSCGQSPASPMPNVATSYIVGGVDANYGDYPWQVGLVENGYLICGGTYVIGNGGDVKIITAAHCVTGKADAYSVVFGMHQTTSTAGRLIVPADSIYSHLRYNTRTLDNDIAVISFNNLTPGGLSNTFAAPACLPSRTYGDDEMSVVSGWGTTSEGGSSSSILKYVWKPILNHVYCNTQTGNSGEITSGMLCAGNAGKDACQGDSGGPLVVPRNGVWELVGVVSWGYGCGRDNYPGVYADVDYFRTNGWLSANL